MKCFRMKADKLPQVNLVSSVEVTPPYVHMRRRLDEYVMYIVVGGEMNLVENGITYNLKQNDIIILSPEYEHYGIDSTQCEYYYVHFKGELEEFETGDSLKEELLAVRFESLRTGDQFGKRQEEIIIPKYMHFSSATSVINIVSKTGDIITSGKDKREYFANKSDCMLMELMIELSRAFVSELMFETKTATTKASRKVFDLLNYFNSYYMEDISGDSIEDLLGCNFDYLNRVFKQATGKTIFNYLNELRIAKAKLFLESGLHSISDVAEMTGFNDAYYFSKVFKKFSGTTPGRYSKSKKLERKLEQQS